MNTLKQSALLWKKESQNLGKKTGQKKPKKNLKKGLYFFSIRVISLDQFNRPGNNSRREKERKIG